MVETAKVAPQKRDARAESLARAEARIRELRTSMPEGVHVRDRYEAPEPPPGFDYQWKVRLVMGEEMINRINEAAHNGWEPVPLSRHPHMMPKGWKGETIEIDGLVLMERPMIFTEEARASEQRAAREAVLTKEQQLRSGRAGDLGPREVHRFSKTRSAIAVPADE